jgi:hypothetical protein
MSAEFTERAVEVGEGAAGALEHMHEVVPRAVIEVLLRRRIEARAGAVAVVQVPGPAALVVGRREVDAGVAVGVLGVAQERQVAREAREADPEGGREVLAGPDGQLGGEPRST